MCTAIVVNPEHHVVMWKRTYYVTVYICNNGYFPHTQILNMEGCTTLYNMDYHVKPRRKCGKPRSEQGQGLEGVIVYGWGPIYQMYIVIKTLTE